VSLEEKKSSVINNRHSRAMDNVDTLIIQQIILKKCHFVNSHNLCRFKLNI